MPNPWKDAIDAIAAADLTPMRYKHACILLSACNNGTLFASKTRIIQLLGVGAESTMRKYLGELSGAGIISHTLMQGEHVLVFFLAFGATHPPRPATLQVESRDTGDASAPSTVTRAGTPWAQNATL